MNTSSEPGAIASGGVIPLAEPVLRGNEWRYVKECLDTNWVSSGGPFVDRFEREFAARVQAKHAVSVVNGTAALHTALRIAGVEADDEVLVSTLTFIAPANAIRYQGAWPVFIDAEPDTWQMDPRRVVDFLERGCDWREGVLRNRATGRRVKAIVPVHILGHPVDLDPILAVAAKFALPLIEDASESLGALYKGKPVGTLGQIGCFSFNGNKLITTGGGGMLVTNDPALAQRAKYLTTQAKDDPLEYVHGDVGYNYRLTNVLAAIGCAQLESLDDYIAAKRRIAATYDAAFAAVPGLEPMREASWAFSAKWLYTVLVDESRFGMGSRQLLRRLQEQRIQSRPLWQALHQSPAHRGAFAVGGAVAERLVGQGLSLPCSVNLSSPAQTRVMDACCLAPTAHSESAKFPRHD